MSGLKYHPFREGDRSEYLANYLLTGLGLVVPVPRQEDIGVDFYCTIADQESGILTFGFPYILQVKSSGTKEIVYGGLNKKKKWAKEEIAWLFRQEQPFFIGIVYKAEMRIDIFSTSCIWFLPRENPNPSKITLFPRYDIRDDSDTGRPKKEELQDWPYEDCGDGNEYKLDLGLPIISLRNEDFDSKERLAVIKSAMRFAIQIEQNNLMYWKLRLPFFNWILKSETNKRLKTAWIYYETESVLSELVLRIIAPTLISLALGLHAAKDKEGLEGLKHSLKKLPGDMINTVLRETWPDVFDW